MNNNILEFYVKMKDMMSGGLAKVAQNAQRTMNLVQASVKNVETTTKSVFHNAATSVKRYVASLRQASQAQQQLRSGGGGSGGGGLGSLVGMIGRFAAPAAIASAVIGAARAAIGGGMRAEMDKVALKTFLGEAGANEAYSNIRKDAARTTYDTASLLMVNRSLISAGLSAKQARMDTLNLANAVAAVGGGNDELSRMAANMQQIKTIGKATAMDIRQFGMAGINIYQMLADATGKNINQVREMDVSYELLSLALAKAAGEGGIYAGALEAMSKTVGGKLGILKDSIVNAFTDIGTKLEPITHKVLDFINNSFGKLVVWIQSLTSSTSEWSGYIDTAKNTFQVVWDVIKNVVKYQMNLISGVVEWAKKSELLRDVFWFIGGVVSDVGKLVMWVVNKLKWLWDNILSPMLDAIDTFYKTTKQLLGGNIRTSSVSALYIQPSDAFKAGRAPGAPGALGAIGGSDGGSGAAAAVTSGGPRTININGVKFTDKIEIHSSTIEQGIDDLEDRFRNMFARLLNSGAALQ